jgi:hypothetical protein
VKYERREKMESNKKTYSDNEIYGALKIIRDICNNNGSACRDCKLSYSENGIPYCGVSQTPNVWRLSELPGEWKPFEKEKTE